MKLKTVQMVHPSEQFFRFVKRDVEQVALNDNVETSTHKWLLCFEMVYRVADVCCLSGFYTK